MASSVASGGTITLEPSENYDLSFNYAGKLPSGATLDSGEVFASQLLDPAVRTTVAADAVAGASTLSLTANVGRGARLTLNPGGATQEILKVSSLSGNGPYVATVIPVLRYAHATDEACQYEPGVSASLLGNTSATITDFLATVELIGLLHGALYRVSMRITYSGTKHLEDSVIVRCRDD